MFPPPISVPNDFIKRLIGRPATRFASINGMVYRNGDALDEPYKAQKPNYELEIKNYGVYVDGSPLDPALANIPPQERSGALPTEFPTAATS